MSVGYVIAFCLLDVPLQEVYFRLGCQPILGYLFGWWFRASTGRLLGLAAASMWFASWHTAQFTPAYVEVGSAFVMGLFWGYLFMVYGLRGSVTSHLLYNLMVALEQWGRWSAQHN